MVGIYNKNNKMARKIVRLTESDLIRLVKKVVKEQSEESPKFRHRLGHMDRWYDEGDRPVKNSDDFDDYDEEMEFGPDDYEEFMNQTKGFKNNWNPKLKHYYDRYTKDSPLKLRRKSY